MPVAQEFEYVKPTTLDEAVSLLAEHGDKARVLAGGTDLALKIKEGADTPDVVIDIKGIETLRSITLQENVLHIGALASFTDITEHEQIIGTFPLLRDAASTVGSVGIRNRATIVGNICSAVPSLDSGPALLVHEAQVHVKTTQGERSVPISEWFTGPKRCALNADELVTGISLPVPQSEYAGSYVKLGRYAGEDLAQAGVGILALKDQEYRVAFCAVGPIPTRSKRLETLLQGKAISDELIEEAKALIPDEISPITDIRSSKEYRILIAKIMFERGLKLAVARLNGEAAHDGALWV
jgi:CO/xanthine dehydrogenase FAD-binding subunit